jgi:predicted phage tail protein
MTAQFTRVEILDSFNPQDRRISQESWRAGLSVADVVPMPMGMTYELMVAVNGKVLEREDHALTIIEAGDFVTSTPIPQGGGGGGAKSILRIAAMIALVVVAPELGAFLGPGMFGAGVLGLSAATWTAGIMIAGTMVINALLPPAKPTQAASNSDSSPTYGIDGAKNTSLEGVPTPLCYGQFRTGGNLIDNYVVNDGDTQWFYVLINAGEGPIAGISDIQINDQPIENFKDYEVQTRLGTSDQQPIDWFATTITPESVQSQLTTDWTTFTTTSEVDAVRLDLVAPQFFKANDDGSYSDVSVTLKVQYRRAGSTDAFVDMPMQGTVAGYTEQTTWITIPQLDENGNFVSNAVYVPDGSETRIGDIWHDPEGNVVGTVHQVAIPSTGGSVVINGNTRSALRRSLTSAPLAESAYDIRMSRTTPASTDDKTFDQIVWTDCNQIINEAVAYRNTALLGIKIRLSDQLSSQPTITYLHGGKLVPVYNADTQSWLSQASNSPAWISLDILTNTRYGGGAARSRFDIPRWSDWADYCATSGLTFDGVFDVQTNVWDANQTVMRCGHAQIVPMGTRYTVTVEKASDPVMMFSVANMVDGSFKQNWLSMGDRANQVEVTFFDKNDSYKPRKLKAVDTSPGALAQSVRGAAVTLTGVTDLDQAWKEAWILLNINKYLQQSVEFSAPIEALACTVGDVVLVQHDMPQWGYAGRTDAGSTTSVIQLDRPITMEFGKTYQAMINVDTLQRYHGSVTSVVGGILFLQGYDGGTKIRRIQVAGKDLEVASIQESGGTWGVQVYDTVGINAGAAYTLWDTDVLELHDVVNPTVSSAADYTGTAITFVTPTGAAPAQFTKWLFGPTSKVAKPFRIKKITGTHELTRDITALEYNQSVYDELHPAPPINYSDLPQNEVNHVTIDGVDEELQLVGTVYQSRVTVNYHSNQSTYKDAEVFLSRNGAGWASLGFARSAMSTTSVRGEVLVFKIVARNTKLVSAPDSSAPVVSYTTQGNTNAPGAVSNLAIAYIQTGIQVTWDKPPEPDWVDTTIKKATSPTGWDAGLFEFEGKLTLCNIPPQVAGTFYLLARHNIPHLASTTSALSVTVHPPKQAATLSAQLQLGGVAQVFWEDLRTDQYLSNYFLRVGPSGGTFAAATPYSQIAGDQLTATIKFDTPGLHTIWLQAVDIGGNAGAPASLTVDVPADASLIISTLTNQITRSQLFVDLGTSIDRIQSLFDDQASAAGSALKAMIAAHEARKTGGQQLAIAKRDLTTTIVDGLSSEASERLSLEAALTLQDQQLAASIEQESTARVDADGALATQISAIVASSGDNEAAITAEATARANADSALASQITNLQATVNTNNTNVFAAIHTEQTARADADSAMATDITTLQSSYGGFSALVSTEASTRASADGALQAQYTVKVDVNNFVSGFGLASTAKNATPFSEFAVRADSFYIASPTGPGITPVVPFIVRTTPTTVNGVAIPIGIYMTNAMIETVSVDKLTAGSIVTSSYIQSANFSAGTTGWQIKGDGTAELNNVVVRGDLKAGRISVGSGSAGTAFYDASQPSITLQSTAQGVMAYDGTPGTAVVTSSNVLFKNNDATVAIANRIGTGSTFFTATATATVDDQISIWYRVNGGSWIWLSGTQEPGDGDGVGATASGITLTIAAGNTVQFGVTCTDASLNSADPHKLYLHFLTLIVTARNF